jgi:hypothetical protein
MTQTLKAVHDDDLLKLLEKLDLVNKFNTGQIKCAFCGVIISFDNLLSLFPDSGTIKLVCTKPSCVVSLMERVEGEKYG